MKLPNHARGGFLAFICFSLFTITTSAHTLPISYLTIVPSGNYLHVELTLNPFELSFLSEFDGNKNNVLDMRELAAADRILSERILQHITIKADGQLLRAETAGVSGEPDSHHFTLRAHYLLADPHAALSIESDLTAITSASHLTEVTFGRDDQRQLARLDSQTTTATFGAEHRIHEATPPPTGNPTSTAFSVMLLLGAVPMIGGFIALLMFASKHLRQETVQH
jgi:hypothetical protein